MATRRPYRAFISYSRADAAVATALATGLTRFARPWYRTRAMRVFLDKNSLASDPTLSGALDRGLAQSEWLVLLASPGSAASPWVRHEVGWWLAHRDVAKLVIARVGGVIAWSGVDGNDFDWSATTALSPVLRGHFPAEPLWADLEAAAAAPRKTLADPVFRDGFLQVAAPLHGIPRDQLWSMERIEQRKRLAFAAGAALAIAGVTWTGLHQHAVSLNRKENIAAGQLGAKAFLLLPTDAPLAARVALAGVAQRSNGIAVSALRHALARIGGAVPPRVQVSVPGAVGLALSADDRPGRLAVLAGTGQVSVLDAASGRLLQRLAPPAPLTAARAIAWGLNGQLAVGGGSGLVAWSLEAAAAGAVPTARSIELPGVQALAFSVDGQRLAAALADGRVHVMAWPSGAAVASFMAHAGGVRAVAFGNDGSTLATGGGDGVVTLWALADAVPLLRFQMRQPIVSVDFNRAGGSVLADQMLVASDRGGETRVVSAEVTERPRGAAATVAPAAPSRSVDFGPGAGAGVAARLLQNGQCLVRASATGPLDVIDTMGFGALLALGPAAGSGQPPLTALDVAQTRRFAVLNAAGQVAVYEQPLCGDAEAVCAFGESRLAAPMALQDRTRWVPDDLDLTDAVQEPPGPACRRLIDRLLPPLALPSARAAP